MQDPELDELLNDYEASQAATPRDSIPRLYLIAGGAIVALIVIIIVYALREFFGFLLVLLIGSIGVYGVPVIIASVVLVYFSPRFRAWLFRQRGFRRRLARLPRFRTGTPRELVLSILLYFVPPTIISLVILLLRLQPAGFTLRVGAIIISIIFGIPVVVLLYSYLIEGWRLPPEDESEALVEEPMPIPAPKRDSSPTAQMPDDDLFAELERESAARQHVMPQPPAQAASSVIKPLSRPPAQAGTDSPLAKLSTVQHLKRLKAPQLEKVVGYLFKQEGYQVRRIDKPGEETVQLLVKKDDQTAVVRCKQGDIVLLPTIRDVYAAMLRYRASEVYLITTDEIPDNVQAWVGDKPIYLSDGDMLLAWIKSKS